MCYCLRKFSSQNHTWIFLEMRPLAGNEEMLDVKPQGLEGESGFGDSDQVVRGW